MNRMTEADTGFRECGVLYVGESEIDEVHFGEWINMAKPYEIGARIVRAEELQALMPGASRPFRCGLHVPSDGCAEPQRAAPAIARAAQRKGAIIAVPCAVRGIERAAGQVAAVITERGRVACESIIIAGGAWTSLLCASLGVRLPQLKVLASVMRTAPFPNGPDACTWVGEVGYRKRRDGGYTLANGAGHVVPLVPDSLRYLREFLPSLRREAQSLRPRLTEQSLLELRAPRRWALDKPSPFEATRVLDPIPNGALNRAALEAMIDVYPGFKAAQIVQQWAGYIDVTPDVVPYIGPIPSLPGITVATGFSGHGFGIGPAAGHLAADLATARSPLVDPTAFRVSRFSDGSPIVLGPEL